MCGIVGYIGTKKAVPILVNGLKKLEYRGYDSAGIAVLNSDQNSIEVVKAKGRLSNLESKLTEYRLEDSLGIGHTRWATHGAPSDINSHPHKSQQGKIVVVHNGIIENYMKLKDELISKGYEFVSETDTEVIAHLIEDCCNGDLLDSVICTLERIEGSYALGIISKDNPDQIIAARKDSPLVIGIGENENFIASDIPAILEHTKKVYFLNDGEIAVLKKDKIDIYNIDKAMIKKEIYEVNWDISAAEKSGYEHFMLKEIFEQPKAIRNTISSRIQNNQIVLDNIKITKEQLKKVERIVIVACGTAYHAGIAAKYVIEKLTRKPVEVDIASEFRYRDPIINDKTLMFIISQSGETADTLAALREGKRRGARVISIVNVVGSSITRESDDVLYTLAGPEIAVASTKAYTTQLSALYLLALYIAAQIGTITKEQENEMIEQLKEIPAKVEKMLNSKEVVQRFAAQHFNMKDVFFIGRGLDYATAMEGSLKLKEISYIHSEAYAAGELKHGTIALIEPGTLVIALATQETLFDKMQSNIKEVKARGAFVLGVAYEGNTDIEKASDSVMYLPKTNPILSSILEVIPLQLFAYYVAVEKGCDVDKPRNLAKSVTVE